MKEDSRLNVPDLAPKDVMPEDYRKALVNLQRFSTLALREIDSLGELAFHMRFVGPGLQTAMKRNANPFIAEEQKEGLDPHDTIGVQKKFPIDKPGESSVLHVTTDMGAVYINKYVEEKSKEEPVYRVGIPTAEGLKVHNHFLLDLIPHARDKTGEYYPAKHPQTLSHIQGYARVIQEALQDLLPALKPPVELPEEN